MFNKDKNNDMTYREWLKQIQQSHNNLVPYNNECPICLENIEIQDRFILQM